MMIVEEILRSVEGELRRRQVVDVRVGLGYTAVKLDDGACGLAATLRDETTSCCTVVKEAGELTGRDAYSLASLALSTDALESALGVATINAIVNGQDKGSIPGDILEHLAITPDHTVGMVGYFKPLIEPIRGRCHRLYIFERRLLDLGLGPGREEVYPDWAVNLLLPRCDVAIITGATIVNKTIDHLLGLCRGEIAIAGPTTPLSPVFADHGVSYLFGVKVQDTDRVLRIISEGGGTRRLGPAVSKVMLRLREPSST